MPYGEGLDYPTQPQELTAGWLTERLRRAGALSDRGEVRGFTTEPVGVGIGLLGSLVRVTFDYAGEAAGAPATLVAKFPAANLENRAVALHFRMYEREVRFYQQIAPHVGSVAPRCYAAEIEPQSGAHVLLLEDLGGYRMGDQVEGCSVADAELLIDAIVPLHARFWGKRDDPSLSWAPMQDNEVQASGMAAACGGGWSVCAERCGPAMPPELAGGRDRWLAAIPALHKMMGSGALTLIHGDLRMDNLMFGAAPGQAPAVAVDWCVCFSLPTQDLAYLFSQNMRIEDRRRHERRLIALYHRKLVEAGVTGYSPDQAWRDYETAVLYLYQYAVTIGGALDPGNARGLLLMQRLVERASTAIMDLGLLDRLPG